jgi:hypothetical protein
MLELINPLVLGVVHNTAVPPLLICGLSWQWAVLAGLWVSIVLYFSDNSLSQGFFLICRRLKTLYCLIRRKFQK